MSSPLPGRGLRWLWLGFVAFVLQLAAIHVVVPSVGSALLGPWLLATHMMLIPFLVVNRRLLGIAIVGVGLLLNVVVMAANGGLMPVTPSTVAYVGRHEVSELKLDEHVPGTKNILLERSDTNLAALSDAIPVNAPHPMRKAVSLGDIFIFSGIALALIQLFVVDRRMRNRQFSIGRA